MADNELPSGDVGNNVDQDAARLATTARDDFPSSEAAQGQAQMDLSDCNKGGWAASAANFETIRKSWDDHPFTDTSSSDPAYRRIESDFKSIANQLDEAVITVRGTPAPDIKSVAQKIGIFLAAYDVSEDEEAFLRSIVSDCDRITAGPALAAARIVERLLHHGGELALRAEGQVSAYFPEPGYGRRADEPNDLWTNGFHDGALRELWAFVTQIPGVREAVGDHIRRHPSGRRADGMLIA